MPFAAKIALVVLGMGTVLTIGVLASKPCEEKLQTATQTQGTETVTQPTTIETSDNDSCYRYRGLRSIFNSRRTTGGGTDVGK